MGCAGVARLPLFVMAMLNLQVRCFEDSGCHVLDIFFESDQSFESLPHHCLLVTCLGMYGHLQHMPQCQCQLSPPSTHREETMERWKNDQVPEMTLEKLMKMHDEGGLRFDLYDWRVKGPGVVTSGQEGNRQPQLYKQDIPQLYKQDIPQLYKQDVPELYKQESLWDETYDARQQKWTIFPVGVQAYLGELKHITDTYEVQRYNMSNKTESKISEEIAMSNSTFISPANMTLDDGLPQISVSTNMSNQKKDGIEKSLNFDSNSTRILRGVTEQIKDTSENHHDRNGFENFNDGRVYVTDETMNAGKNNVSLPILEKLSELLNQSTLTREHLIKLLSTNIGLRQIRSAISRKSVDRVSTIVGPVSGAHSTQIHLHNNTTRPLEREEPTFGEEWMNLMVDADEETADRQGKLVVLKSGEKRGSLNSGKEQVALNFGEQVILNPGGVEILLKPSEKQVALNYEGEQVAFKPGAEQVAFNTGEERVALKLGGEQVALNPGREQEPFNPREEQEVLYFGEEQVKSTLGGKQTVLNSEGEQVALKHREEHVTLNNKGEQMALKLRDLKVSLTSGEEHVALNPGGGKAALNIEEDQEALNSEKEQATLNSIREQRALNIGGDQVALNPEKEQAALNSVREQTALNLAGEQVAVSIGENQEALNSTGEQASLNPGEEQVALNPAREEAAFKTREEPTVLNLGGNQVPLIPKEEHVALNPGRESVALQPRDEQVGLNPGKEQVALKPDEDGGTGCQHDDALVKQNTVVGRSVEHCLQVVCHPTAGVLLLEPISGCHCSVANLSSHQTATSEPQEEFVVSVDVFERNLTRRVFSLQTKTANQGLASQASSEATVTVAGFTLSPQSGIAEISASTEEATVATAGLTLSPQSVTAGTSVLLPPEMGPGERTAAAAELTLSPQSAIAETSDAPEEATVTLAGLTLIPQSLIAGFSVASGEEIVPAAGITLSPKLANDGFSIAPREETDAAAGLTLSSQSLIAETSAALGEETFAATGLTLRPQSLINGTSVVPGEATVALEVLTLSPQSVIAAFSVAPGEETVAAGGFTLNPPSVIARTSVALGEEKVEAAEITLTPELVITGTSASPGEQTVAETGLTLSPESAIDGTSVVSGEATVPAAGLTMNTQSVIVGTTVVPGEKTAEAAELFLIPQSIINETSLQLPSEVLNNLTGGGAVSNGTSYMEPDAKTLLTMEKLLSKVMQNISQTINNTLFKIKISALEKPIDTENIFGVSFSKTDEISTSISPSSWTTSTPSSTSLLQDAAQSDPDIVSTSQTPINTQYLVKQFTTPSSTQVAPFVTVNEFGADYTLDQTADLNVQGVAQVDISTPQSRLAWYVVETPLEYNDDYEKYSINKKQPLGPSHHNQASFQWNYATYSGRVDPGEQTKAPEQVTTTTHSSQNMFYSNSYIYNPWIVTWKQINNWAPPLTTTPSGSQIIYESGTIINGENEPSGTSLNPPRQPSKALVPYRSSLVSQYEAHAGNNFYSRALHGEKPGVVVPFNLIQPEVIQVMSLTSHSDVEATSHMSEVDNNLDTLNKSRYLYWKADTESKRVQNISIKEVLFKDIASAAKSVMSDVNQTTLVSSTGISSELSTRRNNSSNAKDNTPKATIKYPFMKSILNLGKHNTYFYSKSYNNSASAL